jgi:protein gp37
MSDLFHEKLTNEEIAAVFGVMAACPQHTFQVLTKRAKRMREWFEWARATGRRPARARLRAARRWPGPTADRARGGRYLQQSATDVSWPLPNVWLGVSVENQDAADERIPELLRTPAAVRFLSCEPLLGPVDST